MPVLHTYMLQLQTSLGAIHCILLDLNVNVNLCMYYSTGIRTFARVFKLNP